MKKLTAISTGMGRSGELLEEMAGRTEIFFMHIHRRCSGIGKRIGVEL